MKKRIISLLLAVMMIVGMLPMTVLAEEACAHAQVASVYTDNADGTHTVTYTCASCGEAVANAADAVAMDFTAFAAAAAQQTWWDGLRVDATDSNIHYQGALAADTAEEKAQYEGAYESLRSFAQEEFGWTIIEAGTTDVNNSGRGKKLYFNAAEDAQWGMNFAISAGYKTWGEAYTMLELSVDAPAAGTYNLDLTYFEDLSGAKFDLHVNPTLSGRTPDAESKVISGLNTRNSGNIPVDYAAGEVELVEGTNSVIIYINSDTVGAQLKLDNITFTPVALTVDCADEIDGDGKCDDCEAVIGSCQHREVEITTTDNGDKTHTVETVCKFCGEAAANAGSAVVVDFMDFAAKADQQTWWAGLHDPTADDGIKQYGYTGMTDDTTAAYNAMVAWQQENLGWSINASSDFANSGRMKNLYINSNDDAAWGISYSTYYMTWGDAFNQLLLDVTVPAAGTYDLNLDYLQGTAYGCFTVFVNGTQVGEEICANGDAAQMTAELGSVTLNEGSNQIAVKITGNRDGSEASYVTVEVALCAIELAPMEVTGSCADSDENGTCDVCDAQIGTCNHDVNTVITSNEDKTHTIVTTCSKCSEGIGSEENALSIDFMDFAAKADQQTWWAGLYDPTADDGIKQYGYTGMTDDTTAAYNAMVAWQQANQSWSINASSDFTNSGRMKNLYINSNDDAAWGISYSTYYMTWGDAYNQLLLDVNAPAAGTYDLNLDYLQGTAYGCFTVFVNGEQVGEEICANGVSETKTAALGTVTLNEGANQIAVKITGNRDGSEASYVTVEVALCAIDLAPINVTGACADLTGEGECDVCGAVIATCQHVALDKNVTDNGDKTHTVSHTCTACGEAVADAENVLSMDFKAFAKAASAKSFWENLVAVSDGVKNYGGSVTDANTAAYENMISWQGENFDWAVVENGSDYTNASRNKKVILNASDADDWGINFYTYYNDWAGVYNVFKMAVYAREAGTYEMNVDYVQTTRGAYFTVSVNGTQIGDEIASVGAVETKTVSLGTVTLAEGENIVDVVLTKNFQGTTTRLSSDLLLNAIDFVPVSVTEDCADADDDNACDVCNATLGCKHAATTAVSVANEDGTHTTTYTCDACGETVASEDATVSMDFMAAAKKAKAEKPEMMDDLRQSNDPNVVYMGYESAADAESGDDVSLVDLVAMSDWIDANYDWNIDETQSVISDKGVYKRVYLNGADDAKWAFRFVPTMLTWDEGNRGLYLKLDVAQAGTYTMDFEYLQHAAAGVDLTNSGAKVDIKVNDTVVYEGLETDGAVEVKNLIVENVTLVEGENIIAIIVTANKDGGVTNVNTSVDIRKIDFHPVSLTETCNDANGDGICDDCGVDASCKHDSTTTSYIDNGDGTHEVTVACASCSETVETYVEDCMDDDADGYCDACDAVLEVPCDHTNTTTATTSNGDKTHTITVTCECGEVISTETADCADDDKDTLCDDCGAAIVELTLVNVGGSNMTLGNDLKMNFMVKTAELQDGLTMRVTQDGKEPVVLTPEKYNSTYHYVAYSVAAKEMTDVLTVEVLNADGYVISEPYTRTIAYYATNLLTKSTSTDKLKSVAVDMLNYGTEAQKYFSYNEDDYANANISAEDQTAYATTGATCDVQRILGTNAAGTNLSLEASILLNVFFNSTTTDGMTATVTYTNYKGAEVTAEAAVEKYSSSRVKVVVDEIVLADTKRPVTVTVYKDGAEYGSCTEAVGGYATRKLADEAMGSICQAILNFATSAYTYLGGTH